MTFFQYPPTGSQIHIHMDQSGGPTAYATSDADAVAQAKVHIRVRDWGLGALVIAAIETLAVGIPAAISQWA